jgi:hydroxymethylbilane synthase
MEKERVCMQVKLGTRGSRLALRQTELIVSLLADRFPDVDFAVQTVRTEGDMVRDRPISEIGDKGIFVRAIERSLLRGDIDLAVHSLKDVPADVETPHLCLAAFSPREDPRDVLIARPGMTLEALPPRSRIGTGSLRRKVQLGALRPDLTVMDIRGNVDTRIRKLDNGEYDGIILAAAGVLRLGLGHRIVQYLPVDQFVPDAGQGIVAVQGRADDRVSKLAEEIDNGQSHSATLAERATVQGLGAGCHSPVGAYAVIDNDRVWIRAMAAREDGTLLQRAEADGPVEQAESLGRKLGLRMRELLQA